MEDFQSSMLVMATLIITVTFTAAFTLPGGYNGDEPDKGMATLAGQAVFAIFLVTDTMSMCSSIVATAALILFSLVFSTEKRFSILKVAIGAIAVSILFMLIAFAAGVWLAVGSQRRWLGIFIAIVTACIPLCLILLVTYIMGSGNEDVNELLTTKNGREQN